MAFKDSKPVRQVMELEAVLEDQDFGQENCSKWESRVDLSDVVYADDHAAFAVFRSTEELVHFLSTLFDTQKQVQFVTNFNLCHPNVLNRLQPILASEPVFITGGSVLRALTKGEGDDALVLASDARLAVRELPEELRRQVLHALRLLEVLRQLLLRLLIHLQAVL